MLLKNMERVRILFFGALSGFYLKRLGKGGKLPVVKSFSNNIFIKFIKSNFF